MFLVEPPPTPYDLNFSVAGIPVRVHPLFWVVTLLLGLGGGDTATVVIWVIAVFVSILVHELGHALAAAAYGWQPRIVLHQFGGLAIYSPSSRSGWSDVIITAAGPGAGFLFAGLLILVLNLLNLPAPFLGWNLGADRLVDNRNLLYLIADLLYVNLMWGLVNLLPIFPLDGGQISRSVLLWINPHRGWYWAVWLSLIAAGGMTLLSLLGARAGGGLYTTLLFGWLAYSSYQMLEQMGGGWPRRGRGW